MARPAECSIAGCDSPHHARGLCKKHYDALPGEKAKGRVYATEHRDEARVAEARYDGGHREERRDKARLYRATPEAKAKIREAAYRRQYGITTGQYDRAFEALGGKCPLCKTKSRGTRRLAVHHDHTLDKAVAAGRLTKADTVVTLLCSVHNRNLKSYGDSATGLRASADKLDAAEATMRAVLNVTVTPEEHDALIGELPDDTVVVDEVD